MRAAHMYLPLGAALGLACLMGAQPAASEQAMPKWAVGDTWKVGTWYGQAYLPTRQRTSVLEKARGQMIVVTFAVKSITTVADRECCEVEVRFPPEQTGFERCYRLYYCRQTGRLIRTADVSVLPDGQRRQVTTDYPVDAAGPTLVEDLPGLIPFDWPDRAAKETSTGKSRGSPQQATVQARVRDEEGVEQAEEQVILSETAGRRKQVVQRWRGQEPWWREARRYENNRLVSEAVLLEVNGRQVKPPRQAAHGQRSPSAR